MSRHFWITYLALGWLISLPSLRGQDAQHDEVEIISVPSVPDTTPTADLAAASSGIVTRTNDFRKQQERPPVTADAKLTQTAQDFAKYMAEKDRYGHTADDRRPADRAKAHGYAYCIVLENIAYAFNSEGFKAEKLAETFNTGWEKSPGHRKNMLDPDVTAIGVGIARSDKTGYYYAVQMFGRPKSAAIDFRIENRATAEFEYKLADRTFTLPPRYTRTHTVCRPSEVVFQWPGGKEKALTPAAGARLTITRLNDQWQVDNKK